MNLKRSEFESLVDSVFANAKFLLSKSHSLIPVTMIIDRDRILHLFSITFTSKREISWANVFIRSKVEELGALAVVCASDTYRKQLEPGEDIPEGQGVKDLPGAKESILVQGYTPDYYYEKSQDYERIGEEIVFLGEAKAHNIAPEYDRLLNDVFPASKVLH